MFKEGAILFWICHLKEIDSSVYNQYQRMQKKITFKGLIGIFSQLEKLQIVQQKHLLSYPLYFSQQNMLLPNNSLQTHYFSK